MRTKPVLCIVLVLGPQCSYTTAALLAADQPAKEHGIGAHEQQALSPEQFSAPALAKVYSLIRRRYGKGRSLQPAALDGALSPEEMSLVARLMERPVDRANGPQALKDYMEIIETEALMRGGEETDPLLAARDKFRERKAYGGQAHE